MMSDFEMSIWSGVAVVAVVVVGVVAVVVVRFSEEGFFKTLRWVVSDLCKNDSKHSKHFLSQVFIVNIVGSVVKSIF